MEGRALKVRGFDLRGAQNFFFVPRLCQDKNENVYSEGETKKRG